MCFVRLADFFLLPAAEKTVRSVFLKVLTNEKRWVESGIIRLVRYSRRAFQTSRSRPHPVRGQKVLSETLFLLFEYNDCLQRRHQYQAASQFSHFTLTAVLYIPPPSDGMSSKQLKLF